MKATQTSKYPVVVPGVGPVPAPGMIIGEAPGRNEILEGIPFVGPSGALLEEALENFGVARSYVYITNVYKGDVGKGNRNPTPREVDAHGSILRREIKKVDPRAILLLGRFACDQFGFYEPMNKIVGQASMEYAPVLIPCYHPAYILRNKKAEPEFYDTIRKFSEIIG